MKILYIVPKINNEGGVARVLSVKANYLVDNFGYDVHILTQNEGNTPLFFLFSPSIIFDDIILKGSSFSFFFQYKKRLQQTINSINPDIILVCDNGLKSFLIPFILKTKVPVVFESHGSKYIQEKQLLSDFRSKWLFYLQLKFKEIAVKKFKKLVALSEENRVEWNLKNSIVISNPLWFPVEKTAKLFNKKAVVVARHSYEKGIDRLLPIWKKVIQKHPDWKLEIYGTFDEFRSMQKLADSLDISETIVFSEPVKYIQEKYLEATFYLMTSRTEGFPMVLLEAMACGLPVVAYDCPVGPGSIITNNQNGFLIEDGNSDAFVQKIELLIENENLRIQMGKNAQKSVEKFNLDKIMLQWKSLFEEMIKQ